MDITVSDIYDEVDQIAPFTFQESWDNSGLQIGSLESKVNSIFITLDITEESIRIAKKNKCNLIISHHPLFFKPIKTIDRKNHILNEILTNNINVISAHTNLDVVPGGVSFALSDRISLLKNPEILVPLEDIKFCKMAFFITKDKEKEVISSLLKNGVGEFHRYSNCYFTTTGTGHFKAKDSAKPYIKEESFDENKVEFIIRKDKIHECLNTLKKIHPYDELAFDVFEEKINPLELGYGVIGELSTPKKLHQVLTMVKDALCIKNIKFKGDLNQKVKRIALCGGSGASFIKHAIQRKADLYITGDIKYHEILENYNRIIIADIGHRASEQPVLTLLKEKLEKKFPGLEINVFFEHNDFYQYF